MLVKLREAFGVGEKGFFAQLRMQLHARLVGCPHSAHKVAIENPVLTVQYGLGGDAQVEWVGHRRRSRNHLSCRVAVFATPLGQGIATEGYAYRK